MKGKETINNQTLNDAFKHLIKEEPLFKKVLEDKNYKINLFNKKKGFEGLISLIVEQQLSVASAKAIFNRIKDLINLLQPKSLLKLKRLILKRQA